MSFKWYGDEIAKRMQKAARVGINRTMGLAVAEAKATHTWKNRTGTAERSIRIVKAAVTEGLVSFGLWGSALVDYFKALEFGSPAHVILPKRGKFLVFKIGSETIFARKVNHPGTKPRPVLRPSAAKTYPLLGMMIRRAYEELRA